MEDYPKTIGEFESRFSNEPACRDYLVALRWPDGFHCPGCGGARAWPVRATLLECAGCGRQTSVTAGTIFQDTHKPLRTWFRAMWHVTSQKSGASALGLQQALGLGSYQTAWSWLHKLRRAMVRPGRDRLSGTVEVDESYLGRLEEGRKGRETRRKAMVVIAAQRDGAKIGRIRMRRVPDASAQSLQGFVTEVIEPGSVVCTDAWSGYATLKENGYTHKATAQGRLDIPGAEADLLPRVHLVVSLLKRWLMGTHQGAIGLEHLDYYLDEFTFRFNRRASRYRGKLFYRLVQQAVAVDPVTYEDLISHRRGRNHHK
jgi:transposase-like protein